MLQSTGRSRNSATVLLRDTIPRPKLQFAMKPAQIVLVAVGATFAGFLGATAAVTLNNNSSKASDHVELGVARNESASAPTQAAAEPHPYANSELDGLRGSLANLEREVEDLKAELARRAAPGEVAAAAAAPGSPEALAALNRDTVVQILEEQRVAEQKKRDDERKAREKETIDRMAERAAKELGLAPADQTRYADFLTVANAKREEFFGNMRGGGPGAGGQDFREVFESYRNWADSELKGTFGDNLGQQLSDWQREQMRGGGFMGGGDFGRGGGAPTGGATGGTQQGGQTRGRGR